MSELTPMERLTTTVAVRPGMTREAAPAPFEPFEGREFPFAFGRYVIQKKLGQGAMGAVFLALDTELKNRPVALKVPRLRHPDCTTEIERFRREAGTAALLRHPNICKILDVNTQESILFLTMDFEAGQTLQAYLDQQGPVSNAQAAEWMCKIAAALEVAHQHHILHRDLKPGNLLLRRQSLEPVILDFGLARHDDPDDVRLTLSGESPGTPAYMSPEQIHGDQQQVQVPSDLFSLGVILYEMLSGTRPFRGKSTSALCVQIATAEPESLTKLRPSIDPDLAAICHRLLNKKPERRFSTAQELADTLANWQQQHAASASPAKLHRGGLALIAVAVVVALAVLSYGRWPKPGSDGRSSTAREPEVLLKSDSTSPIESPATSPAADTQSADQLQVLQSDGSMKSTVLPSLEIHLQRADETSGYHRVSNREVPIRDGDKLHLRVTLPEPRFIYLYWFDADGMATRFWPETPEQQQLAREIWSPPRAADPVRQVWHRMGGNGGIEMILAATSAQRLNAEELAMFETPRLLLAHWDATRRLAVLEPTRGATEQTVSNKNSSVASRDVPAAVLLVPDSVKRELVVVTSADRDLERGPSGLITSSKGIPLEQFTERLGRRFQSYYGLAFPHAK